MLGKAGRQGHEYVKRKAGKEARQDKARQASPLGGMTC